MPNATNASVQVTIDGKTWEICPLTLEDLEWVELCVKSRAIEAGRMSIPANAEPADAAEMMRPIIQEANKLSISTPDGVAQIATPFGFSRMLYRMLQQHHAHEITTSVCLEWVKRRDVMSKITQHVDLFGIMKPVGGDNSKKKSHQTNKSTEHKS